MKKVKIAINGFGRIGRAAFKIAYNNPSVEIVAINDLTDMATMAHLLKHDSVYREFPHGVKPDASHLIVDGKSFDYYAIKDPKSLPWKDLGVDVVLECTGFFRTSEKAHAHIEAGAKKVIVSAPSDDGVTKTFVLGVNDQEYSGEEIISNASCTTNSAAPIMDIVTKNWGVKKAYLTTIHSYTADQTLVDGPHKDLRRARSAALNIVPTTTGAAQAVAETIPGLKSKFDGLSVRVPTPVVSLTDLTIITEKTTTTEEVNKVLTASSQGALKGILAVTNEPVVSSDLIGNPHSTIVDLSLTAVVDGDLLKIIAWYDNEWGYANRLVEMAVRICQ